MIRPEVKPLFLKSVGFSSGSAAVDWRQAKRLAATTPPVMQASGPMVHPLVEPSMSPKSRPNIAGLSSVDPVASTRMVASPSSCGRTRVAVIRPTPPRTMLMRKTGRQLSPAMSALMRKPARTGPPIPAMSSIGPNASKALARISREKFFVMIAMPWGMSSAPKAPRNNRGTIIIVGLTDSPAAAEASVKPDMPSP